VTPGHSQIAQSSSSILFEDEDDDDDEDEKCDANRCVSTS
jgi:hypothetical protein